jgi:hypothetical protein
MAERTWWGTKYDILGGWSATLILPDYGRVARENAHDQQTLADISLLNWRFRSAAASQAFL